MLSLIFSIFLMSQVGFLIDISIHKTDTIKMRLFQEATKIAFLYIHIIYIKVHIQLRNNTLLENTNIFKQAHSLQLILQMEV